METRQIALLVQLAEEMIEEGHTWAAVLDAMAEMFSLTPSELAILQVGMRAFKLRVDWLLHDLDGDPVEVVLDVMGKEPYTLRRFGDPAEATAWARKWLRDRGFDYWCNTEWHWRQGHRHITLHPKPLADP